MKQDLTILIAEDDDNDIFFLKKALTLERVGQQISIVGDGEEAIRYLLGEGQFNDRSRFPFPNVIFTDLKMPRKNGFELLEWLRAHPECVVIPAIVFSASKLDADIRKAYQMGANAYFAKTAEFDDLRAMIKATGEFWALCEKPRIPGKC